MNDDPHLGSDQSPGIPETKKPAAGMRTAVEGLRKKLIDISKRNRLTNSRLHKPRAKQIDIYDELSDEIFKILYLKRRKMRFKPSSGDAFGIADPDEAIFIPSWREDTPAARHTDSFLQTKFTQEALQKKLLTLYRDASSMEEEQGISVLYLALGFVEWYERESSDIVRYAPLVLLPVDLERDSARGQFRLIFRDQDLEPNLSLKAMLKADFSLTLPDFPEEEDWLPSTYFKQVQSAITTQARWRLLPNTMQLGFYSFAKFLMYRDLDIIDDSDEDLLLNRILVKGFEAATNVLDASGNLDQRFPDPKHFGHIMDADASQTRIIEAARKGSNLVVQGPPGTGKSQTIANIIAVAAHEGKKVLFVAEKRAALDVVHARLEKCELGPLCLELHSHKVSRKHVYAELKQTLELGEPTETDLDQYTRIQKIRDELNATSDLLHTVDEQSGQTPYNVMGTLSLLLSSDLPRPDFTIEGAKDWTQVEFNERLQTVRNLAELTEDFGCEQTHVWRGVRRKLGPIDRDRLKDRLEPALRSLLAFREALETAATAISVEGTEKLSTVDAVMAQLVALAERPPEVADLIENDTIVEDPAAAHALVLLVEECQDRKHSLLKQVWKRALEMSWQAIRREVADRGRSRYRYFQPGYLKAILRIRCLRKGWLPISIEKSIGLLNELIQYRSIRDKVRRQNALGVAIAGCQWQDEETDVTNLLSGIGWIVAQGNRTGSGYAVRRQLAQLPDGVDLHELASRLQQACDSWENIWRGIERALGLDYELTFGSKDLGGVSFSNVRARLQAWLNNIESLDDWHRLNAAARLASELDLGVFREGLGGGTLKPEHSPRALEFVWAEATWKRMCEAEPKLSKLDGKDRSAKVDEFRRLDQHLQRLASQEVMLKHYGGIPKGSAGTIGIVRGETGKKRRHMPIRVLLREAGDAVQDIKPVFLMSPLSVAQYLPPGKLKFDLLLIDEASQVRPEDAVGSIMRADTVVVVGDQKQLPPTSFFDRQLSADDNDDYSGDLADLQAAQVGDMESILTLCEARGMPGGMLEWHYRSSHPSLIAVSNHEFYSDKLICPPSPSESGDHAGMSFEYIGGEYMRGTKRTNPKEAEVISQAVLKHARIRPTETLGVVALSVAQRDAIRNRVEYMRTEYPELEAFCKEGKEEGFFVKNLENVQGDERDVIFVSIGYGRDANGYMSQNFGPVTSDGGERRLNVLFTRAKRRCRIFASIRHGDIRIDAAKHAGPRVLKRFLKFAEHGELDVPLITGDDVESPFEASVARAIRKSGYRVTSQVGSAGFRIDLAVHDPDHEGRFILAVECDGARYHSSSWARERDRLRQAVLEAKGWRFHRIWSTDWFQNEAAETRKLIDAIERARVGGPARPKAPASPRAKVERANYVPDRGPKSVSYKMAEFQVSIVSEIPDTPRSILIGYIDDIVSVEGPVHRDIVRRRLYTNWGNQREGNLIKCKLEEAIDAAILKGTIAANEPRDFVDHIDRRDPVPIRDRSQLNSYMRKPEMLPPAEILAAAKMVVMSCVSISPSECAKQVSLLLGFKTLRSAMRTHLEKILHQGVREGILLLSDDQLRVP